jgi:hypothetical protein
MNLAAPKISAPGVYTLSMADYHGNTCVGPSISASGLTMIERYCPARFYAESYLNPNRAPEADTEAMLIGRAMHTLILEGDEAWSKEWAVEPADADRRTKVAREWIAERAALGIGVIRHRDWLAIKAMADAVRAHPMASKAFTDGEPERSLVWQDTETKVWLKSRPDWLPHRGGIVPNYKTALCAKPDDFERQAFALGYHQSAALCQDGMRAVLDRKTIPYFIVQEKVEPHLILIATMKDEALEWARLQNQRALRLFADCLDRDQWPGYADDVVTIGMPGWTEKRLEQRSEAGEFAAPDRPRNADWATRYHAPLEQGD